MIGILFTGLAASTVLLWTIPTIEFGIMSAWVCVIGWLVGNARSRKVARSHRAGVD